MILGPHYNRQSRAKCVSIQEALLKCEHHDQTLFKDGSHREQAFFFSLSA